jgi:hypothetical protein
MIAAMSRRRTITGAHALDLDAAIRKAVPALVRRWDGGEMAVASIVEVAPGFGVAWFVRGRLVADLHRRGQGEQAVVYKEKYRLATVTLQLPRAVGKVSCVIEGGDVLVVELDADELRWGQRFTAPGGTA